MCRGRTTECVGDNQGETSADIRRRSSKDPTASAVAQVAVVSGLMHALHRIGNAEQLRLVANSSLRRMHDRTCLDHSFRSNAKRETPERLDHALTSPLSSVNPNPRSSSDRNTTQPKLLTITNRVELSKTLQTFVIWWTIGVVALFVLDLAVTNPLIMKTAAMLFALMPIAIGGWAISTIRPARNRRFAERSAKWDAEHPHPSEEFKEAMRDLK